MSKMCCEALPHEHRQVEQGDRHCRARSPPCVMGSIWSACQHRQGSQYERQLQAREHAQQAAKKPLA
eukprot:7696199-Heterocapsa_arctica.AAC.1